MLFIKVLPQVVAWIASLWGIWTGNTRKRYIKVVASLIASGALVVSMVLTIVDAREAHRKQQIQDMFLFANTRVQTISVRWEFFDVDPHISQLFEIGDTLEWEFWESFDWTDTPDRLMQRAFHVEYRVQPIINALATGDQSYPFLGLKNIPYRNVYESPQEYALLFPMNVSLDGALILGEKATMEHREYFEERYAVVPYPAPRYAYEAVAEKTDNGLALTFSFNGTSKFGPVDTIPSLYGFNIVLSDRADVTSDLIEYFVPDSYWNMNENEKIAWKGYGEWYDNSELTIVINGIEAKPVKFNVNFEGRYIHAPWYTDEAEPYGEFIFSIFHATYAAK